MKCISERWQTISSKILSSLLLLLGFSACGETTTEYGTPYAKHTIKGKVVDKNTGSPVLNANVIVKSSISKDNYDISDILKADDKGEFIYSNESAFPIENYWIIGEDKSGYYKTDSVEVEITNADLKGGKNWYAGEAFKDGVIIELEDDN